MELTPELQEKKRLIIDGLKKTYKVQYDAVQPIPYVKDRLYCVDKVFVEGGVEVCLASELTRDTGGSWERLESYKNIYTDFRINSKRRIIQGEPGYGKSTLTLQLAYDWCNDVWNSSMRNVEILILLRLRQLGGIQSIYRAIKLFLLAHESGVTVDDIKKIIQNCPSVSIILDGYDEYPNRDSNQDNDVDKMIVMELFQNVDVTVTTRYLPKGLIKETKRAKLTGFDDKARNEYIRKAVVGDNDEAVENIKQRLYENSVLADLCQVPLIFVMFAHMAHDLKLCMKFTSVTQFFKYMIGCFHEHLKRKLDDISSKYFDIYETEHNELDKIAFEGLNMQNQQLSWNKKTFQESVSQELYKQYISIGILVEEQVVSGISEEGYVLYTTEVRFYHKLFCEWYAAHYFVSVVMTESSLEIALRFLDPFDLQYLYRFACGLHPDAGKKLIDYLKSRPGGDTFAILCILEQTGDVNDIMDSVKELCSRDVKIQKGDSALLQRSTTQLLEIASNNNIPITGLHLNCSSVKIEGETVVLHSGIPLPKLPTVEMIHLAASDTKDYNLETLTEKDIVNWFHYGIKSRRIKELMFEKLQLPTCFPAEALSDIMKNRNIQVRWRPFDMNFHWDPKIADWEVDSIDSLRQLLSDTIYINGSDDILKQRSTIQLIHIASNHEIPISTLYLEKSFGKIDAGCLILTSGLKLFCPVSLKKLIIHTKDEREMTETEFVDLLNFVQHSPPLEELRFDDWMMPVSFTNTLISRNIYVSWCPFDDVFYLDLQTGHWEVDSIDSLRQLCSDTIYINGSDDILKQRSTIQLIQIASNHDIPITCLYLQNSFSKLDAGNVILHSGLRLSCPVSIIQVVIGTKEGKEMPETDVSEEDNETTDTDDTKENSKMTETEFVDILTFVQTSHLLKKLRFEGGLMPICFSPSSFMKTIISWNINVSWCPFNDIFRLDLQTGHWEVDNIDSLRQLCSGTINIEKSDGILKQRSTIQLTHIASNHDIPISSLYLNKSFDKTDDGCIILTSGLKLSCPVSVKKLIIHTEDEREMTETEFVDLLNFVQHSHLLKELMFGDWMMPVSFSHSSFTNTLISRNIYVSWCPFDDVFHLDLQTGHWEVDSIDSLRQMCSDTIYINGRDGILKQRSTIQLIHIASNHEIPISCLHLRNSFKKIDSGKVIFHSRLSMACPVTVKELVINTETACLGKTEEENGELKETEIVDILTYVQDSPRLKELRFDGLLLPVSFSTSSFTKTIISRNISVSWCPFNDVFRLDLQTGQWEVENIDSLRQRCSGTITLDKCDDLAKFCASNKDLDNDDTKEDVSRDIVNSSFMNGLITQRSAIQFSNIASGDYNSMFFDVFYTSYMDGILKQRSIIQLIHIASIQGIPISCLCLEKSFKEIDDGRLFLKSGLCVPCPASVKKVVIKKQKTKTMTEIEVAEILMFVLQSHTLEELEFSGYLLPLTFSLWPFFSEMQYRNIKVFWKDYGYSLNLQSRAWEVDKVDVVRNLCTKEVCIRERDVQLLQRCTLQLLENASNYDIPISCLYLGNSFRHIDAGNIILWSGLRLSCPLSVKKVEMKMNLGRQIKKTEFFQILMFVQQSHMLEELEFKECFTPQYIPAESIPSILKSRNVKVSWWVVCKGKFTLNLQSGRWIGISSGLEMTDTEYNESLRKFSSQEYILSTGLGVDSTGCTVL